MSPVVTSPSLWRITPSRRLEVSGHGHLPSPWLPGGPAAVDQQARAGNERGRWRGEEDDRARDLLDRTQPAQRDAVEHPFAEDRVVEERLGQWGRDKGRR